MHSNQSKTFTKMHKEHKFKGIKLLTSMYCRNNNVSERKLLRILRVYGLCDDLLSFLGFRKIDLDKEKLEYLILMNTVQHTNLA